MDKIEEIKKLKALFDEGAITQEEFDFLKRKILSSENESMTFKSNESQVYEQKEEKIIIDKVTSNTELNSKPISPIAKGFYILIGIIILFFLVVDNLPKRNNGKNSTSNPSSTQNSSCIGNEGCISNVRERFTSTGKTILSEKYLGDGEFGISFLDTQRGETFNATVTTDCNCKVINVHVSRMQ